MFAVVQFSNKEDKKDTISTVPLIWVKIVDGEVHCQWPPKLKCHTSKKKKKPEKDWTLFPVKLIGKFGKKIITF